MASSANSKKTPLAVAVTAALVIGTFGAAVPVGAAFAVDPVTVSNPTMANSVSVVRVGTGKYKVSLNLADSYAGKTVTVKVSTIVNGKKVTTSLGTVVLGALGVGSKTVTKKIAKGYTLTVTSSGTQVLSKKLSTIKYVPGPTALQVATSAVVDFESNGTDAAKATAVAAVNQLPAGADHDALQLRIDAKAALVTAAVNAASTLVTAYESVASDANKTAAQTAVTALPAGAAKTALQARIDAKGGTITAAVAAATAAVVYYEQTGVTSAKTSAQTLVSALPAGTAKTGLQARIDALPAAEALVVTYETTGAGVDATAAQSAVTALPTGVTKTDLQQRITLVSSVVAAVVAYENAGSPATLTAANSYLLLISSGALKTALTARVGLVSTAIAAVVLFESTGTLATQQIAASGVAALSTGTVRTALSARILTSAVVLVGAYEASGLTSDATAASTAVGLLPAVSAGQIAFKAALVARIAYVPTVVTAVDTFTGTGATAGTLAAQVFAADKVAGLPTGALKTAQTARIFTAAVNAVIAYEASGTTVTHDAAVAAVALLTPAVYFSDNLTARITLVATAVNAVVAFEGLGTLAAQNAANTAVGNLPPGTLKTALNARIFTTAVNAVIAYEAASTSATQATTLAAANTAVNALPAISAGQIAFKAGLVARIAAVVPIP